MRPADYSAGEVRKLLSKAPGVKIVDDTVNNYFPMLSGSVRVRGTCWLDGSDRTRSLDPSGKSIAMFVAGDQLLKGAAALNGIQIAEVMVEKGYI